MKNTNRIKSTKKQNQIKSVFSWTFNGQNFTQKHKEIDYRVYLDRNYISKSNIGL